MLKNDKKNEKKCSFLAHFFIDNGMIRATKALYRKLLAIFQNKYSSYYVLNTLFSASGMFFVLSGSVTIIKLLLRLFFTQLLKLWQANCSCFRVDRFRT